MINKSTGKIEIHGGYIASSTGVNTIENNNSNGVLELYGGTIVCKSNTKSSIYTLGQVNVYDVNIISDGKGIEIRNNGKVEMSGGIITSCRHGIYNYDGGTIEFSGGDIIVESSSGTYYGIYNYNNGNVKISGGTITVKSNGYGVYNYKAGSVEMSGGTVNSNTYSGICNESTGTVIVTNGTINSTTQNGVYNVSTGTITIGEKDGTVKETLVINAGNRGVYNKNINGKVYYYDGIISGKNEAIYGVVNEIEDNKEIILSNDETYEIARLGNAEKVAYVGDEETNTYDNLETAINACGNEGKITLLKDIVLVTNQEQNIANNTKVTLNLNGKQIKTYAKENLVTNNGELTITDLSEDTDGKIWGYGKNIILNEEGKILNIEKGTIELKQENSDSNNYIPAITSNGTMNITGGNINTTTDYSYAVNNSSKVEMTGGNINTTGKYGYGINNTGTGTLTFAGTGSITTSGERGYGINNLNESKTEMTGGSITTNGTRGYGIASNSTEKVQISNGTITTKGSYGYALSNLSTGTIEMSGGTVITTETHGIGIFNESKGTVIISGGIIDTQSNDYDAYGVQNYSTGEIKITGGTITTNSSRGYGVYNSSTGKVEILDVTVTTKKNHTEAYGVYNSSTGEVSIIGGNITSNYATGIYNKGTITLGRKGGNVQLVPTVTGSTYGVQNVNGTFNFYDGIIKGKENQSISGSITEIEEGYSKETYKNEESDKYDIGSGNEVSVLETSSVAIVESTGTTPYPTLRAAVEAAGATDKITLTNNITITELETTIEISKNITLDLNGYTVDAGNGNTITNTGTLTIIDGTDDKNGTIISQKLGTSEEEYSCIINNGTLNIESGKIQTTKKYNSAVSNTGTVNIKGGAITTSGEYGYGIKNTNEGNIQITGGTITTNGTYGYGIYNDNAGTITLTGTGNIITDGASTYGIYSNSTGNITITGGNITTNKNSSSGICNVNTGTVEMTGGTITEKGAYGAGIKNLSTGTVNISGTANITTHGNYANGIENTSTGIVNISGEASITVNGSYGNGIQNTGTTTIEGGNITSKSTLIENTKTGKVEIKEGRLTSINNKGIENSNTAEVKMTGGTLDSKTTGIVNNGTGKVTVTGGEITSSTDIGINNTSSGTIIVGAKDGNVINSPVITAGTYALRSQDINGKLYYYDGILKAKEQVIIGIVNGIEDNKDVVLSNDENYEIAVLGTTEDIAYVGDNETNTYDNLESAITACGQEGKITLLKNILIPTGKEIVTTENAKITLNLNGKDLRTCAYQNAITNKGEIVLTDSSEDNSGNITGYGKGMIVNEEGKTLTIESGTIQLRLVNGTSDEYLSCIINEGTLNIKGGSIITNNRYSYAVNSSGTVNMSAGSIITENTAKGNPQAYARGINNNGTGTVNITGGAIKTYGGESTAIDNRNSTGKITFGGNGEIDSYSYGIYNTNTAEVEITGGSIVGSGVYNTKGSVKVENGTISTIYNSNILNIKSGTIGKISTYKEATIENATISDSLTNGSEGTTTIQNITINSSSTAITNSGTMTIEQGVITGTLGIKNSGTLTINNATISGIGTGSKYYGIENSGTATIKTGSVTSDTTCGIYNTKILTLGEKDSNAPSITNPEIVGKTYGVKSTKTFNFYDGIIKGETSAISGTVTDTPIVTGTEDNYKVTYPKGTSTEAILGIEANIDNTIELDGEFSKSLEEAILRVKNKETKTGTIRINNDITLESSIEIPENVNITFELRGHVITYNETGTAIVNNGNLIIIDYEDVTETSEDETSTIRATNGTAIENNGTLTIGQTGSNNANSPLITGSTAITGNE